MPSTVAPRRSCPTIRRQCSASVAHKAIAAKASYHRVSRLRKPLATKAPCNGAVASTSTACNVPRILVRPNFGEVRVEALGRRFDDIAGVPVEYIRDTLALKGDSMLAAVSSVRGSTSTVPRVPNHSTVTISPAAIDNCPTHLLAVYAQQKPSTAGKRKVTLFPAHDIVLAAHCSKLPLLAASSRVVEANGTVTLPIVPLCIPSVETFPILQSYLYTKRTDLLLSALLPSPPTLPQTTSVPCMIPHFATHFSEQCSIQDLLRRMSVIHALWRNMCALGVIDEPMWEVVEAAWESILGAIERRSMSA